MITQATVRAVQRPLASAVVATLALWAHEARAESPWLYGIGGGSAGGADVVVDPKGAVFVVGEGSDETGVVTGLSASRFRGFAGGAGVLDEGYGDGGHAIHFTEWAIQGTATAAVSDGEGGLVVVGVRQSEWGSGGGVVVRFDERGALLWERPLGSQLADVARDAEGHFVVVGAVGELDGSAILVARLTAEGHDDLTFGDGGQRLLPGAGCGVGGKTIGKKGAKGGAPRHDSGSAVLVDARGIVVGGSSVDVVGACGGGADMVVLRLTPSGELDESFGVGGRVQFDGGADEAVTALALRDDGALIAAGQQTLSEGGGAALDGRVALWALKDDGARLGEFGVDGFSTFGHEGEVALGADLLLDDAGRVVVAGRVHAPGDGGHGDLLVERYARDGRARDEGFATDGVLRLRLGALAGSLTLAQAINRLADGSMLIAGRHVPAPFGSSQVVVVPIDDDGRVVGDPSARGPYPIGRTLFTAPAVELLVPRHDDPDATMTYDVVADVRYPAEFDGLDVPVSTRAARFPLVLVNHGRHPAGPVFPGFAPLLDHLASHGFIAVSIDADVFRNAFIGPEAARGRGLLAHLDAWRDADLGIGPAGALFVGKVDGATALIGHSQGGGAALEALRQNVDEGRGHAISAVLAIAPTDGSGAGPTPAPLPPDTAYLCLYGSNDGDVGRLHGFPYASAGTGTCFRAFDRAQGERTAVFIEDATHNLWNTLLPSEHSSAPDAVELSRRSHEALLQGYAAAFLKHWRGEASFGPFLRGTARLPVVSTLDVRVQHRPGDGGARTLEDFDDANPAQNSVGGATSSTGVVSDREGPLFELEPASPHRARGRKLRFNAPGAQLQTTLPTAWRDFTGHRALALRIGRTFGVVGEISDSLRPELDAGIVSAATRNAFALRGVTLSPSATVMTLTPGSLWLLQDGPDLDYEITRARHDWPSAGLGGFTLEVWRRGARENPDAPLRFDVALTDSSGRTAVVDSARFTAVQPPTTPVTVLDTTHMWWDKERTLAALTTVRVPVSAFTGINLTRVSRVSLRFDRAGEVLLDDIELWR